MVVGGGLLALKKLRMAGKDIGWVGDGSAYLFIYILVQKKGKKIKERMGKGGFPPQILKLTLQSNSN